MADEDLPHERDEEDESEDDSSDDESSEAGRPDGSNVIRINFGRPMPLFPLHVVTLMPQAVLPLHIFEDRYRQMVADALDGPGQIAMAIFRGDDWRADYEGTPPLREAVCVSQIMQHQKTSDGRYHVALHGVCRARILDEIPPSGDKLYRRAMLEPMGLATPADEARLVSHRHELRRLLSETRLRDFSEAASIIEHIDNPEVPTSAVFELITFTVLSDNELRYKLLAEPSPSRRAALIGDDLRQLQALLERAAPQVQTDLPKGVTYN